MFCLYFILITDSDTKKCLNSGNYFHFLHTKMMPLVKTGAKNSSFNQWHSSIWGIWKITKNSYDSKTVPVAKTQLQLFKTRHKIIILKQYK